MKGEPAPLDIYFITGQSEQEYDLDQQGPLVRLWSDNFDWAKYWRLCCWTVLEKSALLRWAELHWFASAGGVCMVQMKLQLPCSSYLYFKFLYRCCSGLVQVYKYHQGFFLEAWESSWRFKRVMKTICCDSVKMLSAHLFCWTRNLLCDVLEASDFKLCN